MDRHAGARRSGLAGTVAWAAIASLVLVPLGWLVRERRCASRCAAALATAERRAAGRDLGGALAALDDADAACRCERGTAGDEPPAYAAARCYLGQLRAEGRGQEAREILAHARGPILRSLAAAAGPWASPRRIRSLP